jgi:ABC-type protease/lipase transport system fused ATPase/permease subunit
MLGLVLWIVTVILASKFLWLIVLIVCVTVTLRWICKAVERRAELAAERRAVDAEARKEAERRDAQYVADVLGNTSTMVEVDKSTETWRHVHTWFHAKRVNPNCPWCAR